MRFLFFILFFAFGANVTAQDCTCNKLNVALYQSEDLVFDAPEKAKSIIKSARSSNDPYCQSIGLLMEIRFALNENELERLDEKFETLITTAKKSKCSDSLLIDTYLYQSEFYYYEQDFGKSFQVMTSYLEVAKRLNEVRSQFTAYRNMAMLLDRMGQTKNGIPYSDHAYDLIVKYPEAFHDGDPVLVAGNFLWYYQDYDTLRFKERCIRLLNIDEELSSSTGNHNSLSLIAQKRAALFAKDKNFELATQYMLNGIKELHQSDDEFLRRVNFPSYHRDVASYSFQSKNYNKASQYMDSCYFYLGGDTTNSDVGNFYELSYKIAKANGDFSEALNYFEKLKTFEDKIKNEDQLKLINEYEQKYQKAENELKISELNSEKQIDTLRIRSLIGIVIAVVLALLILFYFFRQSRKNAALKIVETEQRLNRARMNPHFFFNALSSIQTMALKEQQPKIASLLTKFSRIMRQSLESTYVDMVNIEEEKEFLEQYLELQKLRHPKKFDYEIIIDDKLDPSEDQVPSMLIQPFVENAIEHGFACMEEGGLLEVAFDKVGPDQLKISINDNGQFFSTESKHKEYPSRATQIVKDRLFLLKNQTKKEATFSINQHGEFGGYEIVIILPMVI